MLIKVKNEERQQRATQQAERQLHPKLVEHMQQQKKKPTKD